MEDKTIYQLNHEIEKLQDKVTSIKKEATAKLITDTANMMFQENSKEPLNSREFERLLKSFYYEIKEIQGFK